MNDRLIPFERREPALSADQAAQLLRGDVPAAAAAPAVHAVAGVLGALRLPPSATELADESMTVAIFERACALAAETVAERTAGAAGQSWTRSLGRRRLRLAVVAAAGSLVLGGVAAAAVTGSLPRPFSAAQAGVSASGTSAGSGAAVTASGGTGKHSARATASASASRGGAAPTATGSHPGLAPTVSAACQTVVGVPSGPVPSTGKLADVLAHLRATAASQGLTLAQLCTKLLNASASPAPSASGTSGLGGVLPLPSLQASPGNVVPSLPSTVAPGGQGSNGLGLGLGSGSARDGARGTALGILPGSHG